jgi:excisionase family DNA binding protein
MITEQQTQTGNRPLTIEGAVVFTGLSRSYIYKLVMDRKIPHYKPRGKMLYFDRDELARWLLQGRVRTREELDRAARESTGKGGRHV